MVVAPTRPRPHAASSTCPRTPAWLARRRRVGEPMPSPARKPIAYEKRDLGLSRAAARGLSRRSPRPSRSAACWSTAPRSPDAIAAEIWAHVERRLLRGRRLMARAPAIAGRPRRCPRPTASKAFRIRARRASLFGHGAAERELAQSLRRRAHAPRLADRRTRGHRQGDAGLSPGAACAGATRGARSGGPQPRGRRRRPRRRGRCARCRIRACWCCAGPTTRAPSASRPASPSTRCAG